VCARYTNLYYWHDYILVYDDWFGIVNERGRGPCIRPLGDVKDVCGCYGLNNTKNVSFEVKDACVDDSIIMSHV